MIDSVKRLSIASDVTYKLFRAFALSVMSDLDCLITSGEKDKGIGRGDFKKDCIDFIRILMNFSIVKKEKNICIPVCLSCATRLWSTPTARRWTTSRTVSRGAMGSKKERLILIGYLNILISIFYVFMDLKWALSFSIERVKNLVWAIKESCY